MPEPSKINSGPIPITRRRLLQAGGVGATAIALGISAPADLAAAAPPPKKDPFQLGVAAGAPRADGMILWTRLAPEPLAEDGHGGMATGSVKVTWQVSDDRDFERVLKSGTALAQAELAHSIHPRVTGLEPATEYFYRFRVGRHTSPTGRFRTLPAKNDRPEKFTFGVTSCQAWYHGHFTALKHLAAEDDLDLVLLAGDYIYEYGITAANLWRQGVSVDPVFEVEVETLEQHRLRYALFKSDPHLQALHARVATVAIWDDHEVQNDYVGATPSTGIPADLFVHRIAVSYRAFYEHLPLDLDALPDGPSSDITTGFDVGRLARFSLLDTRQFRDPLPVDDDEQNDPNRSMLGAEQEAWITERLEDSPATWNLINSGVAFTKVTENRTDQWDGFPAARQRLLDSMAKSSNAVVLSGDIHHHVTSELRADFDDPDSANAGIELICTSVASDGDGAPSDGYEDDWMQHDWMKLYDGRRGYLHATVTPEELISDFVIVGWVEADDTAEKELLARFRTPAGASRLDLIGGSRA